ncbi:MAG: hypothetical protein ACLRQF_05725 [Thomasclavelia ramosa]
MFLGLMQQDTIRARLQTMHQEIHNIARELKLKVPVSVNMGVTKYIQRIKPLMIFMSS